jgi:RimJ/RimL family protein N-acetyltransferase
LRALCRAAFTDAGYRKLTAMVTPGKVASKAVRGKVGFVQEGPLRESYLQLATSDRKDT